MKEVVLASTTEVKLLRPNPPAGGLTKPAHNFTLRGGVSFMAEDQGEIQKQPTPETRQPAKPGPHVEPQPEKINPAKHALEGDVDKTRVEQIRADLATEAKPTTHGNTIREIDIEGIRANRGIPRNAEEARLLLEKFNVPATPEAIREALEKGLGIVAAGGSAGLSSNFRELPTLPSLSGDLLDIILRFNQRVREGKIDGDFARQYEEDIKVAIRSIPDSPYRDTVRGLATYWFGQLENDILEEKLQNAATEKQIAEQTVEQRREAQSLENQQLNEIVGDLNYDYYDLILDSKKRYEVFNNIFSDVDSNPHEFWQSAFNIFTHGRRLETFIKVVYNASVGRFPGKGDEFITQCTEKIKEIDPSKTAEDVRQKLSEDLREDLKRFQTERRLRSVLHDMSASMYQPSVKAEQIYGFIQGFSSQFGDLAYRMTGVREMMDLYEANLRQDMVKHHGFLDPEAVLGKTTTGERTDLFGNIVQGTIDVKEGEVEKKTKEDFMKIATNNGVFQRAKNGEARPVTDIKEWESDRIFTIARAMMVVSERLFSLAAESKLGSGINRYPSLFLQDVLQSYSPYVHLLAKYNVTESGLAAYLYQPDKAKFFSWGQVKHLKEVWHKFKEGDVQKLFDGAVGEIMHLKTAYLKRQNPNRAGDVFTWVSWRAEGNIETNSMVKDFLINGQKRMVKRFMENNGIDEKVDLFKRDENVSAEDYGEKKDPKTGQVTEASPQDILVENAFRAAFGAKGLTEKEKAEKKDEIKRKFNEYSNWIGTGIRFERFRGDLEKLHLRGATKEDREAKEKAEKETLPKAMNLLKKMSEIQPHRLYLKSKIIRDRVNLQKRGFFDEQIEQALADLGYAEKMLYQKREKLLEEGKTFETIELDFGDLTAFAGGERATRAQQIANIIKEDYSSHTNLYKEEFIDNREYEHGFVLWTGDAPVDEFNASITGPTGAFARRARDNEAQGKAFVEEIKLLEGLKNFKTPEQVMQALHAVYSNLAQYDAGKAKQSVSEKAEGILKFYASDNIIATFPILGPIAGYIAKSLGRGSFAQIVYGRQAAVWETVEKRHFLNLLKSQEWMEKDQYERVAAQTGSTKRHVTMEAVSMAAQLITLALILYLMQRLMKENLEGGGGR